MSSRPFTGVTLDRATSERQDPAVIERLLHHSETRSVAAGSEGVVMSRNETEPALLRLDFVSPDEPILLGIEEGSALFAVDLDALEAASRGALLEPGTLVSLREAGALLPRAEGGLAAYLTALLNWHRRHRFCANCGVSTVIQEAGYSRLCPSCKTVHFPRTDPVVIMAVEHDGRLLLGRRRGWPPGRCSVLAGFVAPGESVEEAVVREVREESGILARDPTYVTSQPWPFPSSLMLGFDARADGGEPTPRDGELEEVSWFSVRAVRNAIQEHNPALILPPPVSVARFLIERWVAKHAW